LRDTGDQRGGWRNGAGVMIRFPRAGVRLHLEQRLPLVVGLLMTTPLELCKPPRAA
jgi:hypothetical protein